MKKLNSSTKAGTDDWAGFTNHVINPDHKYAYLKTPFVLQQIKNMFFVASDVKELV